MIRGAASVVLALLVLSGCGTRPTGHGAPPYEEPASVTPVPIRTHYSSVHLDFTLPPMAGEDENAVRAYIRFSVAEFRAWRSGHQERTLVHLATPDVRRLVRRLTPVAMKYGALDQPTRIEIRSVSTQGVLSSMRTCIRHDGRNDSTGTLLVQSKAGRWRVSASAPLHHRLKNCGS